jgi:hypothetical protein
MGLLRSLTVGGIKSVRILKHKLISPLSRPLNVISFKYSTIRAMFYDRVLWCRALFKVKYNLNIFFN